MIRRQKEDLIMSKRMNFVVVVALAFAALLLLPLAASAASKKAPASTTIYYAFTGIITKGVQKSTTLVGGLALNVDHTGAFMGTYHAPDNSMLDVNGMGKSDGSINLTMSKHNMVYLKGQGKVNANREFLGTFQTFQMGKQSSSGSWSAILANPKNMTGMAFQGQVIQGQHKGSLLAGAILLDNQTLKGTLLDAAGNLTPCHATLNKAGKAIKIVIGSNIVSTGQLNNSSKSYKGEFMGPATNDMGNWEASIFSF
jgi:hypothetical protein